MLAAAVALVLYFLPWQVNGLITTDAKCLPGFEWMFSSVNQSPCDIAAELRSVCVGTPINLVPLPAEYHYVGPTKTTENACWCNSVVYSLMSGCGYCQNRLYIPWSTYSPNCSTVYASVFPRDIPIGVKVPAYAYQDVPISGTFNVTLAQSMVGRVESSRLPSPSTSSSSSDGGNVNNTPAIIGGVVGGILGLTVIAAVIYFVLRSKQKQPTSQTYKSGFKQSHIGTFSHNTTASLIPPMVSPALDSSSKADSSNHQSAYSPADANSYSIYGQHSPSLYPNVPPNYSDNDPSRRMAGVGRTNYSGWPEP